MGLGGSERWWGLFDFFRGWMLFFVSFLFWGLPFRAYQLGYQQETTHPVGWTPCVQLVWTIVTFRRQSCWAWSSHHGGLRWEKYGGVLFLFVQFVTRKVSRPSKNPMEEPLFFVPEGTEFLGCQTSLSRRPPFSLWRRETNGATNGGAEYFSSHRDKWVATPKLP